MCFKTLNLSTQIASMTLNSQRHSHMGSNTPILDFKDRQPVVTVHVKVFLSMLSSTIPCYDAVHPGPQEQHKQGFPRVTNPLRQYSGSPEIQICLEMLVPTGARQENFNSTSKTSYAETWHHWHLQLCRLIFTVSHVYTNTTSTLIIY